MRKAQLYFQLHLHHTTEKGKEHWSKPCPDGETAAVTAHATAAGHGGRGLLSSFPCALHETKDRQQGQRKEENLLK